MEGVYMLLFSYRRGNISHGNEHLHISPVVVIRNTTYGIRNLAHSNSYNLRGTYLSRESWLQNLHDFVMKDSNPLNKDTLQVVKMVIGNHVVSIKGTVVSEYYVLKSMMN